VSLAVLVNSEQEALEELAGSQKSAFWAVFAKKDSIERFSIKTAGGAEQKSTI
jgi:hypothetical protein